MSKKRGLGRGLQALIPDVLVSREDGLVEIPVDKIRPRRDQPRKRVDDEKLVDLMNSIKSCGVIQPILVRKVGEDDYEIIAGERRWRACRELNIETIPAVVRSMDDLESTITALVENIQRENLNPLEEAETYRKLIEDFGLTQDEVSERVGRSRPAVANLLRLLNLPSEVKEKIAEGKISAGHARALAALGDSEKQRELAESIVEKKLNVRKTEELVKRINEERTRDEQELRDWEKLMEKVMDSPVKIIENKKRGGRIVVEYGEKGKLYDIVKMFQRVVELNINVSRET